MKNQFSCTVLFQFISKGADWDTLHIQASDVRMPSETYQGKERPKTYWPIHTNYSQACKLVNGMSYLATFTLTPEKDHAHPTLKLSELDPVPNKLEQRGYIRELMQAQ